MRFSPAFAFLVFSPFVHAQLTVRVSIGPGGVQANGNSGNPSLSADASAVAFDSLATNLVAGDINGFQDVFVRDFGTATTELASVANGGGGANGQSHHPVLSADGSVIAFVSAATNLVPGGSAGPGNVFVRDRASGTTTLVSAGVSGTGVSAECDQLAISADGRFVAFRSAANDVVAGDANPGFDVFVFDRVGGTTEIASRDSAGQQLAGTHESPSLSDDGRFLALASSAPLASGASPSGSNVFLRDRWSGSVVCVSVPDGSGVANGPSERPSLSGDGRCIAFRSSATNLTADALQATYNIYVRETATGRTRLASNSPALAANASSGYAAISYDGRYVAFDSTAWNLSPSDNYADWDVFLRDRWVDLCSLQTVSSSGLTVNGDARAPAARFLSADGQTVVFSSAAGFVAGDSNGLADVFVHGRGAPPVWNLCFGDGSSIACPCANYGGYGRGCDNSNSTGGALLFRSGISRLTLDTLVLRVHGEPPDVFNMFLQSDATAPPALFGDGIFCLGGGLLRLYTGFAVNGAIARPGGSDLSVSTRAAALGYPIPMGATRCYQVLYRDPESGFCPPPSGANFNLSQAVALVWGP